MKKIFISQPMRDKTNEEIIAEREVAITKAREILGEDCEIIESFFEDAPHEAAPLWFLSQSLKLLASADAAYFVKGWKDYRGCRIENLCAHEYGINVIHE